MTVKLSVSQKIEHLQVPNIGSQSMALSAESSILLHLLQNVLLILFAVSFTPLWTFVAIFSRLFSPFSATTRELEQHRRACLSRSPFTPRTILVTGVGMAKGLAISRAFYREGHTVIGADFEPYYVPVSGRFSRALSKFYRLPHPPTYITALIDIINRNNVDIWVSCSGVASATDDGRAADLVEQATNCKVLQFGLEMTETLHEKHSFIDNTKRIGLNVPVTQLITSVEDAMGFFTQQRQEGSLKSFILKSVGMDDSIRADMTLLPKSDLIATRNHIVRLRPSPSRPFVLQQFISGPEYCTHSIVIRGKVLAFTSCKSAGILMHYKALPVNSELNQAMLQYTDIYVDKMGSAMTGHFSIDFLVDESGTGNLLKRIYPIECNPRAHTAVVMFEGESEKMVEAYLGILKDDPSSVKTATTSSTSGYYWIGHDIVEFIVFPIWGLLTLELGVKDVIESVTTFLEHLLFWREGTFATWDPLPGWWLYCGYWPAMFMLSILTMNWWSKCNVSTNKMFRC